jgi:hypothetical protein
MTANGFWRALERHVAGATAHEWKRTTGREFDVIRQWLRPLARKAMTYPVYGEWGYESRYDVIEHGPSDIVAVCQETGDRKVLAPADIVLYAVNRDAILRTLAESLGLESAASSFGETRPQRIGAFVNVGKRVAVDLCWYSDAEQLLPAAVAWIACGDASGDSPSAPTFRFTSGRWHLAFEGVTEYVRDRVGLHYIRYLLAEPNRIFESHELVELRTGQKAAPSPTNQRVLDAEGKRALETRLLQLSADRASAERQGDQAVLAEIDDEFAAIASAIERSHGLYGRARSLESGDRKHRRAVAKAIDEAIDTLRIPMPRLAEHLDAAIEKRGGLRYVPKAAVEWRV